MNAAWGLHVTSDSSAAYAETRGEALRLLEDVARLVSDLPSPGVGYFHAKWSHVADLEQTVEELRRIRDRTLSMRNYSR
jgi:hypothetical protein